LRIYPSPTSDKYDKFFQGARPYNKFIHRVLFSSDVLEKQFQAGVIPDWVDTQIDQLDKADGMDKLMHKKF